MGFDMGHVVIRRYEHLGPGIDYEEVERVKEELTHACREIPQAGQPDSPVYTFISDLAAPLRRAATNAVLGIVPVAERERQDRTLEALSQVTTSAERAALKRPFAVLMKSAREALRLTECRRDACANA